MKVAFIHKGYLIDECGRIFSNRRSKTWWKEVTGALHDGYRRVKFAGEFTFIHRVICEVFHGPRPEGMECRHLDGNRSNNHPSNLRWGTRSENQHECETHGTTRRRHLVWPSEVA